MGLGDLFKQVKSWAEQAVESQPQWARVVSIGGAVVSRPGVSDNFTGIPVVFIDPSVG